MPGTFLERIVGRGVGLKKAAAVQPRQSPNFAFHAASYREGRSGTPDTAPVERYPIDSTMNEENSRPFPRKISTPDSLRVPPENGQLSKTSTNQSNPETTPSTMVFSSREYQKHLLIKEPSPLPSINPAVSIEIHDKAVEVPGIAKRGYLFGYDGHRKEKAEDDMDIIQNDSPSAAHHTMPWEKVTRDMDAASEDIHISAAPAELSLRVPLPPISNQPIQEAILKRGEALPDVTQKSSTNFQDRSVTPVSPLVEPFPSAVSPKIVSEQPVRSPSFKPEELIDFAEISEMRKDQDDAYRFEMTSKIYDGIDDKKGKRSAKIMPALTHPQAVPVFEKRSIEPEGPDQVNVSIGTIEIRAEAQPAPLPVEPAVSYGFGEYESVRRYLSL